MFIFEVYTLHNCEYLLFYGRTFIAGWKQDGRDARYNCKKQRNYLKTQYLCTTLKKLNLLLGVILLTAITSFNKEANL